MLRLVLLLLFKNLYILSALLFCQTSVVKMVVEQFQELEPSMNALLGMSTTDTDTENTQVPFGKLSDIITRTQQSSSTSTLSPEAAPFQPSIRCETNNK